MRLKKKKHEQQQQQQNIPCVNFSLLCYLRTMASVHRIWTCRGRYLGLNKVLIKIYGKSVLCSRKM